MSSRKWKHKMCLVEKKELHSEQGPHYRMKYSRLNKQFQETKLHFWSTSYLLTFVPI